MGKWFSAILVLMLFLLLQVSGYVSYAPEEPERQEAVVRLNRAEHESLSWEEPMSPTEKGIRYILSNNYAQSFAGIGLDASQLKDCKDSKILLLSSHNNLFTSDRNESPFRVYVPPLQQHVVDYYVYTLRRIQI